MDVLILFLPAAVSVWGGMFIILRHNVRFRRNTSQKVLAALSPEYVRNYRTIPVVASFTMGLVAVLSWWLGLSHFGQADFVFQRDFGAWFSAGDLSLRWGLRLDNFVLAMTILVTTISFFVYLYSLVYMEDDDSQDLFFVYLCLFSFFMLSLVMAPNLLELFFGWEGVGLMSYLLIGFYQTDSASLAAQKAFVVNRIADVAFMAGLMGLGLGFHTLVLEDLLGAAAHITSPPMWLSIVMALLFVGAMGKSAQILFHVWLPDAMEGPTPVSALIHAATMVTAGVFLVGRLYPLFTLCPLVMHGILIVGVATALFGALCALCQSDIKRVVAFSTCSQLGYMFASLGAGGATEAVFHLLMHGFFKALLFLGAGSVIYHLNHEQNIFKMGALMRRLPWTYGGFLAGSLALSGLPPFSGFYSKEAIMERLEAAEGSLGDLSYLLLVFGAFLTAVYTWRLFFLVFHGTYRGDSDWARIREKAPLFKIVFVVLGLGSLALGELSHTRLIGPQSFLHPWLRAGPAFAAVTQTPAVPPAAAPFLGFGDDEEEEKEKEKAVPPPVVQIPVRLEPGPSDRLEAREDLMHLPIHDRMAVLFTSLGPFVRSVRLLLGSYVVVLFSFGGFLWAWGLYVLFPRFGVRLREMFPKSYNFLKNQWYDNAFYDRVLVKPLAWVARGGRFFESSWMEQATVRSPFDLFCLLDKWLGFVHPRRLSHNALGFVMGLILFLLGMIWMGSS